MSKKKQNDQHPCLKVEDLSISQIAILDAYAALMDPNEYVWEEDLIEHLQASEFKTYWQRGDEWQPDRLQADIASLMPSFFVIEGGGHKDMVEDTFYMPMIWNAQAWKRRK